MSEAELRAMVRDVLREALGKQSGKPSQSSAPTRAEAVSISSDADLAAFVRRVVALMDTPATAAALRSGQHRFTLAAKPAVAQPATAPAAPVARAAAIVLEGTVTEAKINKCAGSGSIVLAPGAVITPLARDRARALGLKIERKR
jgi:hypothetical protein